MVGIGLNLEWKKRSERAVSFLGTIQNEEFLGIACGFEQISPFLLSNLDLDRPIAIGSANGLIQEVLMDGDIDS